MQACWMIMPCNLVAGNLFTQRIQKCRRTTGQLNQTQNPHLQTSAWNIHTSADTTNWKWKMKSKMCRTRQLRIKSVLEKPNWNKFNRFITMWEHYLMLNSCYLINILNECKTIDRHICMTRAFGIEKWNDAHCIPTVGCNKKMHTDTVCKAKLREKRERIVI